ncbi:MAG: HlyD family efflux transporter periplasmic adaptor subunit [Gammaproteobacteria bacterium]|nr:HlyD family efflux transporter periplasmic adaptor subunit [Gammaproteobacteria bacterium]MDH4315903.1 HlyD family efflux transporter periplasmic adaptor subunit [Gammaproteobacteria bacterium]
MNTTNNFLLGGAIALLLLGGCDASDDDMRIVGQLESDRVELTAEVAETIREKRVVEGQAVVSGEPLIVQDKSRIDNAIAEAKAALAQSRARQDELIRGPRREQIVAAQANVAGAERELEFRQGQFERAVQLFQRDLASPDARDQAKAALDGATSALEFHRARLSELLSGTTVEELRQAEQNVRQFEARLAALDIDLQRHTISAPRDGLVDSILFEPGERPSPGQAVVIMLSGEQPYARVYITEALRVKVRPGTAARVHVDGIATPFKGSIRWVASDAAFTPYFALTEHDRSRLSYLAKIDILDSKERLPDGVPVEVELDIGHGIP